MYSTCDNIDEVRKITISSIDWSCFFSIELIFNNAWVPWAAKCTANVQFRQSAPCKIDTSLPAHMEMLSFLSWISHLFLGCTSFLLLISSHQRTYEKTEFSAPNKSMLLLSDSSPTRTLSVSLVELVKKLRVSNLLQPWYFVSFVGWVHVLSQVE